MREAAIQGKRRRAFRVTTDSKHNKPISGNHLDRHFAPAEIAARNHVWAGDITYLATRGGWLYLAVVLDLFSRRVIGWSMSHSLESRIVLDALQMAVERRPTIGAVLFNPGGSTITLIDRTRPLETARPRSSLAACKSRYLSTYPRHNLGLHVNSNMFDAGLILGPLSQMVRLYLCYALGHPSRVNRSPASHFRQKTIIHTKGL
jgi:transposase InsO family protein